MLPAPWAAVRPCSSPPPASSAAARAGRLAAQRGAAGALARWEAVARRSGRPAAVLHPGVDLEAWRPAPAPAGPPHALVLGALVPWKRPDLALDVALRMPELRLTIAGAPLPGDDGD